MNGDSLAEGTRPYIPVELPRWRVKQSTSVSRHAYEGDDVMRRLGSRLPRVIHVSLGTNDDPGDVDGFRDAIADVMKVAGGSRCVVWANIVRPPYRGVSYRGLNRALAEESSQPRQPARAELGANGAPAPGVARRRRRARVGRGLQGSLQGGRASRARRASGDHAART